jgi:RNA polymerase sigma-70 factor (ECF subfamily)
MPIEDTDEALMLRYASGDAASFAVLYARHRSGLFRFCLRMCRDRGRAEEVFQDAWLQLMQARERYRVEARFVTFLYQIARNRMLDVLRRDRRMAMSLDDTAGSALAATLQSDPSDEPERRLSRLQGTTRLVAALEALPEAQREAFLLHEEGELTLEEIGVLTGVGRETVKSRVRYALGRLRDALAGERHG